MLIVSIVLSGRQLCDLELLMNGAFSPLTGFMTSTDYESVLDRIRLQDGTPWPIPICLDIPEVQASRLEGGQSVAIRDPEGYMLAVMHIEEIWPIDKKREAEAVYGTTETTHHGVDYLFHQTGTHYVGGRIEGINAPLHFDFKHLRMTPHEVRAVCTKLGWRRMVGFQTRNPLHRAQFEMTLEAMREARANLLLQPVVGYTKPGDIDYYTRCRCYQTAARHYPPNMMLLSLLPLAMRMAGPREALWHALILKNYGCTHFVVGRDHAGPGLNAEGKPFYEPLIQYITSAPVVVMVVEGPSAIEATRNTMGATNPVTATPGTIRADYGLEIGRNLVHGSDGPKTAAAEIALWFDPSELLTYQRDVDRWILE